jgi:hypothetical protein
LYVDLSPRMYSRWGDDGETGGGRRWRHLGHGRQVGGGRGRRRQSHQVEKELTVRRMGNDEKDRRKMKPPGHTLPSRVK